MHPPTVTAAAANMLGNTNAMPDNRLRHAGIRQRVV
jgi:hypothetical protein